MTQYSHKSDKTTATIRTTVLSNNNNNNNKNNNNNNQRQCLWCCPHDHGHCESSPGSFDECRLSAGWPPTLRPSQPTWAVSPPINGCYRPHPPPPFVIITQPESILPSHGGWKAESTWRHRASYAVNMRQSSVRENINNDINHQ